jgi:3-phosphoshikimate 1-carboxyvinyltransferase
LTALLMALPLAGRCITIKVSGELISKPYIDITLNLLARFGVAIERDGWSAFTIPAQSKLVSPGEIFVEGDASGASYFLAAGAIGGGPVRVAGVGRASIQGDVGFANALARMGARIEMSDNWIEAAGPSTWTTPRFRPGLERHARRCHDAGRHGAVRRWHQPAAQHRQLAREGD